MNGWANEWTNGWLTACMVKKMLFLKNCTKIKLQFYPRSYLNLSTIYPQNFILFFLLQTHLPVLQILHELIASYCKQLDKQKKNAEPWLFWEKHWLPKSNSGTPVKSLRCVVVLNELVDLLAHGQALGLQRGIICLAPLLGDDWKRKWAQKNATEHIEFGWG